MTGIMARCWMAEGFSKPKAAEISIVHCEADWHGRFMLKLGAVQCMK
jgi:hypothetical protein